MTGGGGGGGGDNVLNGATQYRSRWVGRSVILPTLPSSSEWLQLFVLTISMFGMQLVWSCEMAQASPYLLSLGVSKSHMAIVFVAGPLSGLLVQPIVGVLSDGCRSSLGRRRPFIIAGCAISSLAVLMLGWAREFAGIIATTSSSFHTHLTIALAILAVYLIDFSINVVQAMDRALLVDVIPPEQQATANAWASRMFGFGSVFGFWIGGQDLVGVTGGFLGDEQLKVLTFFTAFLLCACHAVTCSCVQERVLISREAVDRTQESSGGAMRALNDIWSTLRSMPKPIQQVFNVQFSSWIGWFPVLFFGTTWVAEIYIKENAGAGTDLSSAALEIREEGTRVGTRAMLFHAIISLATSLLLPPLVAESGSSDVKAPYTNSATWFDTVRARLPTLPFDWLTLPRLWTFSNAMFGSLLFLGTYLSRDSVGWASAVLAAAGFCWAVTNWAPFAILGNLILRIGGPQGALGGSLMLHERGGRSRGRGRRRKRMADHDKSQDTLSDPHFSLGNDEGDWDEGDRGDHDMLSEDEVDDGHVLDLNTYTPRKFTSGLETPVTRHSPSDPGSSPALSATPPSTTSAYFDAGVHTPDSERSESRAWTHSHERTPSPTIVVTAEPTQSSAYPFDFHASDPYASTATIRAHEGSDMDMTPTILQVRHSDDTFSYRDDDHTDRGTEVDEEELRQERDRLDKRQSATLNVYGKGFGAGASRSGMMLVSGEGDDEEEDDWANERRQEEIVPADEGDASGDQAGVILGCHNIYLVLPQFLVTALSSIIFAILAPNHSVIHTPAHSPATPAPPPPPPVNLSTVLNDRLGDYVRLAIRSELNRDGQGNSSMSALSSSGNDDGGWDALGLVFRIGGIAAFWSAWVCFRMARDLARQRQRDRERQRQSWLSGGSSSSIGRRPNR